MSLSAIPTTMAVDWVRRNPRRGAVALIVAGVAYGLFHWLRRRRA